MRARSAQESKPNWLLIKEHDEYERPADAPAIVDEASNSVITHRDLEPSPVPPITSGTRAPALLLTSGGRVGEERKRSGKPKKSRLRGHSKVRKGLRSSQVHSHRSSPPRRSGAPIGKDWLHELKLDGYRIQVHLRSCGKVRTLLTRSGLDWTHRMPDLAIAEALPAETAMLDGEVMVLDERGSAASPPCRRHFRKALNIAALLPFDLLHLDGHSCATGRSPSERHCSPISSMTWMTTPSVSASIPRREGRDLRRGMRHGAEGIVSKLSTAPYLSTPRQSVAERKVRPGAGVCHRRFHHAVKRRARDRRAVARDYHNGKLRYAGRAGTGFTQQSQRIIRENLDALVQPKTPLPICRRAFRAASTG